MRDCRRTARSNTPLHVDRKIREAIDAFRAHLRVDRGFADDTAYGYCSHLAAALRRLRTTRLTTGAMRRYLLWMRDKGYSFSAQLNTTLAFEAYARMNGRYVRFGRQPKPKRVLKGLLSEAEVNRMIQMAETPRLKAIMAVLAYSGVRCAEFVNLRVDDYDLGANEIRVVLGKNNKDRIVRVSAECTRLVADYLRTTKLTGDDWLFTTVKRGAPLARADLRKIIKVLARHANIGRRVYPHLFRHSLASTPLNRGASFNLIRQQLGHAFLETTLIYAQSLPARERSEYELYKPAYV